VPAVKLTDTPGGVLTPAHSNSRLIPCNGKHFTLQRRTETWRYSAVLTDGNYSVITIYVYMYVYMYIFYLSSLLCIYCLYLTPDCSLFSCRTAGQRSAAGRSCDRPSRHRFFLVFLGPTANAGMVPVFFFPSCHYMLPM
jgi:hypothetical protein